jgi:hypothetical protein
MVYYNPMIPQSTPDDECVFCPKNIEEKENYTVYINCLLIDPKTTCYEPTNGNTISCSECEEAQSPLFRVCSYKCFVAHVGITPGMKFEFLEKPPEWWIEKKKRDNDRCNNIITCPYRPHIPSDMFLDPDEGIPDGDLKN